MWITRAMTTQATSILLLAGMLMWVATPTLQAQASLNASHAGPGWVWSGQPSMPRSKALGRDKITFSANGDIYIMSPDGSALRQLTFTGPAVDNRHPALSLDGTRIAFSSNRGGNYDIYTMDTMGGNIRRLTTNKETEADPAWSPDGSRIAFVRGLDLTINGNAFIPSCVPSQIYVIEVEGGLEMNLTGVSGGTDPAWSPDGTRIAFSSYRDGNYDIYKMDADGSNVKQLTSTDSAEADPVWSPDGQFIAYGGNYIQWRVLCGFMHTGREEEGPGGPNIFVMTSDGLDQRMITETGNSSDPTWSPDGAHIAYVYRSHGYTQIYRIDTDGQNRGNITSDAIDKSSPSWSGGSYLAPY
jgi:Tol biopolymer transport system component